MGNKSVCELSLSFLLIAALCLEALIIEKTAYYPSKKMNWAQARLYCQKNHFDLVTPDMVKELKVAQGLMNISGQQVWIGLLRDPGNNSVWRSINLLSGEGISGNDLSQSSDWADGQTSRHCARMGKDSEWYSESCSSSYDFYCSGCYRILHHKISLTWDEASQYCRQESNNHLATITNTSMKDIGWIGLYREAGDTWNWIGEQPSDFRNWAQGEPLTADCGSFDPETEKLSGNVCAEELPFVCYDDRLVLVNENKTWEDALFHCRSMVTPCYDTSNPCKYQHDLLSLDPFTYPDSFITNWMLKATTDEVWTGLRFLGGHWWWVDGQELRHQAELPGCPSMRERCGTLSKSVRDQWTFGDCSERRNFICYRRKIFPDVSEDKPHPVHG